MKRGRSLCGVLAMAAVLTGTAGCWDVTSPELLRIPTIVGVDWRHGRYAVSVQAITPSAIKTPSGGASSTASHPPIVVLKGSGRTFLAALVHSGLNDPLHNPMTLAHLDALVLGRSVLAPAPLAGVWDSLLRNPFVHPTFWILATRGPAESVVAAADTLGPDPLNEMRRSLDASREADRVARIRFWRAMERIYNAPFEGILVPRVRVQSGDSASPSGLRFRFGGGAVLVRNRLVGWLDPRDVQAWLILTNHSHHGALTFRDGNERVTESIGRTNVRLRWSRGVLSARIEVPVSLREVDAPGTTAAGPVPAHIGATTARALNRDLSRLIAWCQGHDADLFRLEWRGQQANVPGMPRNPSRWPRVFARSTVHLSVRVTVVDHGMLR